MYLYDKGISWIKITRFGRGKLEYDHNVMQNIGNVEKLQSKSMV